MQLLCCVGKQRYCDFGSWDFIFELRFVVKGLVFDVVRLGLRNEYVIEIFFAEDCDLVVANRFRICPSLLSAYLKFQF